MWNISGRPYLYQEFQEQLQNLPQTLDERHLRLAWWIGWCSRRRIDSFYCDINPVLDFFGEFFQAGYEFWTTDCHRSAISAYRLL